jgi:hypothetical protein
MKSISILFSEQNGCQASILFKYGIKWMSVRIYYDSNTKSKSLDMTKSIQVKPDRAPPPSIWTVGKNGRRIIQSIASRRLWADPRKKRVIYTPARPFIERSCAVGGRYPPGSSNVVPPLGGGTPLVAPLGGATPVALVAHHHRVVLIRIAGNDEVGFIIKAALAFKAKAELVFIPFG